MRRVYSQSSDQMKNSAIGRPNCRTASVRRNSEIKLAITAGIAPPHRSRQYRGTSSCAEVHRLVGAVRGVPGQQPQSPRGRHRGQQGGQRVRVGGSVSSSMIRTALHPSSAAVRMPRQSRPHRRDFSPDYGRLSLGIAGAFVSSPVPSVDALSTSSTVKPHGLGTHGRPSIV